MSRNIDNAIDVLNRIGKSKNFFCRAAAENENICSEQCEECGKVKLPEAASNPGIVETEIKRIEYDPKDQKKIISILRELVLILRESLPLFQIIKIIISIIKNKEEEK